VRLSLLTLTIVVVVAVPLTSRAQQPAAAPGPPAAPAAAPAPYGAYDPYAPQPAYGAPPPQYGAPPPQYGAPPPQYGAPPYGYGYAGGPTPMQLMMYESGKKTPGLALVLDIIFPGIGSIYADHATGAAITWGGMIGGFVLIVVGVNQQVHALNQNQSSDGTISDAGVGLILVGALASIGFRIYGVVDAYSSAKDYNANLAKSLRLPEMNLSLAPLRTPQSTALAPTFTLRF
jgi:Borrelia membrane protein P13